MLGATGRGFLRPESPVAEAGPLSLYSEYADNPPRFHYSGRPATLGSSLKARVDLVCTCRDCLHQAAPDLAEQVARHGAEMTVIEWQKRLVCSRCGSRNVDCVVSGYKAPSEYW